MKVQVLGAAVMALFAALVVPASAKRACGEASGEAGRELFLREWVPGDSRSLAGDGLGPAYNERSCVACHNLGSTGGGGAASQNVNILTLRSRLGVHFLQSPANIHPGFAAGSSIVLHRFGTDAAYEEWRQDFPAPDFKSKAPLPGLRPSGRPRTDELPFLARSTRTGFDFTVSQRNPTALFGAGAIDAIPEEVIEAAAGREFPGQAAVKGRVSRLPGGRIGRFGWKAQVATLADFTRAACSTELGLEVPGHPQPALPTRADYRAPGLDLGNEECDELVTYIRMLTPPVPEAASAGEGAGAGKALFHGIGCAACHVPELGAATGIYSDLLLHDMGPALGDVGSTYYGAPAAPPPESIATRTRASAPPSGAAEATKAADSGATPKEWRTPPLWGCRYSAPYLHDGRAETLEAAITSHAGEAESAAGRYQGLEQDDRLRIVAFLESL